MKKKLLRAALGSGVAAWSLLGAAHEVFAQPVMGSSIGVAVGMTRQVNVIVPGSISSRARPDLLNNRDYEQTTLEKAANNPVEYKFSTAPDGADERIANLAILLTHAVSQNIGESPIYALLIRPLPPPFLSTVAQVPAAPAFANAPTRRSQSLSNQESLPPSHCVTHQFQNLLGAYLIVAPEVCGPSTWPDARAKVRIADAGVYKIDSARADQWSVNTLAHPGERQGDGELDEREWQHWSGTVPDDGPLGNMTLANTGLRYTVRSRAIDLVLDF
jgi:hypothetical protein